MGYLDGSLKHAHADTCDTLHPRLSFSLVCVPEPEARPKIGIVTLMRPFHGNHSPARGGPQHRRRRLREIHRHEIFRVIRKRKNPRTRPRVTAADMPLGARYLEPRPHGSPRECQIRRPQGAPDLRHRQHRVANGRFCQCHGHSPHKLASPSEQLEFNSSHLKRRLIFDPGS